MPRTIERILAPTDLSPASRVGLAEAADLAARFGAELTALSVTEDDLPPIILGMSDSERKQVLEQHAVRTRHHLEKEVETLGEANGVEVAVLIGRPGPEITRYADEHDIDLIVMASHGRGYLGQLLLGSTTTSVLHRASCPVLVVPVREE